MTLRGEETKEKILEQAVDLFYQYGFARASTRQLVDSVGMTSSAIYNHFANKEEILFTIIQRAGGKVLITLKEATQTSDDPVESLREMIRRMLNLFSVGVMRKEIAIFIDEMYQLPEDLRELCNGQHRQIFEIFRDKIREIQDKYPNSPIDNTVATFGVIGSMLWVYHWYRDNGSLSIEQISDELIKLIFKGLVRTDSVR